jgi:hypothetical protein
VWQGWVVFALYLALVGAICVTFPPGAGVVRFVVLVALATGLPTLICWITGEPPHWSWGERRDGDNQEVGQRRKPHGIRPVCGLLARVAGDLYVKPRNRCSARSKKQNTTPLPEPRQARLFEI